ncbi:putative transport protein [Anaerosphaera aminiphila DSM 21120]|uniref:Putative transport protein n=1 Tax=Anaerosphaera aminiphila DSM 21120 TaxID=1120995 RepID=A0A1M5R5J9_9FIRM|nr:antiporter [Anaerosphaera aminiphila]SHH21657.1 putative transport protein [Anaerosphaera aminiphila DSM 21120]
MNLMDTYLSSLNNQVMLVFLILALGFLVGRIKIAGVQLGVSGVLVVALVAGHLGFTMPSVVGDVGIVLFLGCVGLVAGSSFFKNLKRNFLAFVCTSLGVVILGGIMVVLTVKITGMPTSLALGISSGALTSTSSLGSTIEITGDAIASVGYGITYIFGTLSIVLFVQIIPKLFKVDTSKELEKLREFNFESNKKDTLNKLILIDKTGIFVVCLTVVLGALIGGIELKLGPTSTFSLRNSGGALIAGLLISNAGHIGRISLEAPVQTLKALRDLGISLFLAYNGLNAGHGFLEILSKYGFVIFIIGAIMSVATITVAFIISRYIFKLPLFAALGATTGAMTSAPSLNVLVSISDDSVTPYYAVCQPIATIALILLPEIVVYILS